MRIHQKQSVVVFAERIRPDVADQQGHVFTQAFGLCIVYQVVAFGCKTNAKQLAVLGRAGLCNIGA